jgi:ABC-type sugar transport system ATPase subunit
MIDDLGIDCSRASLQVSTLSGGNQQKVVLGKWLNRGSSVLLLDEPTRGVDVPAKAQIYDLIRKLAADGTSILFVSSEEEEMYGLCDRIVVLKAGAVVADARPSDLPLARLLEVEMGGMI